MEILKSEAAVCSGVIVSRFAERLICLSLFCSLTCNLSTVGFARENFGSYPPSSEASFLNVSVQKAIGLSCEIVSGVEKVSSVESPSRAMLAGIHDGDEVLSAQFVDSNLALLLKRDGVPFSTTVDLGGLTELSAFEREPFQLQAIQNGSAGGVSENVPTRLKRLSAQTTNLKGASGRAEHSAMMTTSLLNGQSSKLVDVGAFQSRTPQPDTIIDTKLKGFAAVARENGKKIPILDVNDPVRLLAKYQLELIVDQSLSMRRKDCPGMLSRWDWCGVQANELSRAISPFAADGLTITPFASNFQVYKRSKPEDVVRLFGNPWFHFGTRLAEPLSDRLNDFFVHKNAKSKPLLIAVITDGVPVPKSEPQMVINELVAASHKMSNQSEVTVVFFQIGGQDRFGHNFLQYLDQNLNRDGARYHLVHTVPFEQLVQSGLSKALVHAVQSYSGP